MVGELVDKWDSVKEKNRIEEAKREEKLGFIYWICIEKRRGESGKVGFILLNELPFFWYVRVWRAVLSSLRDVALDSTTKEYDEEGLRFGVGVVNKEEEEEKEGNAQEWRNAKKKALLL